jgi:hypothetical protein
MVRVAVSLDPFTATEGGMLQVTPTVVDAGVSAQARLTVPLKPFVAVTVTVELPPCPADAMLTGVAPTEKPGVATKPGHAVTRIFALIEPKPVTRS